MDKYKTSVLGQALKKVYHGDMSVSDSVMLAKEEINRVFEKKTQPPGDDTDDGFIGDEVGACPLCKGKVERTRFGYGCNRYKDGCKFSINGIILERVISISDARKLLTEGKTATINGFVSKKSGKQFSAVLKLENGKINFDFN